MDSPIFKKKIVGISEDLGGGEGSYGNGSHSHYQN